MTIEGDSLIAKVLMALAEMGDGSGSGDGYGYGGGPEPS